MLLRGRRDDSVPYFLHRRVLYNPTVVHVGSACGHANLTVIFCFSLLLFLNFVPPPPRLRYRNGF